MPGYQQSSPRSVFFFSTQQALLYWQTKKKCVRIAKGCYGDRGKKTTPAASPPWAHLSEWKEMAAILQKQHLLDFTRQPNFARAQFSFYCWMGLLDSMFSAVVEDKRGPFLGFSRWAQASLLPFSEANPPCGLFSVCPRAHKKPSPLPVICTLAIQPAGLKAVHRPKEATLWVNCNFAWEMAVKTLQDPLSPSHHPVLSVLTGRGGRENWIRRPLSTLGG